MIRKAQPTDFDAILKLNNSFVPKVSQIDLDWIKKYHSEAAVFDVVIDNNEIMGFVVAMKPQCDYKSVNFLWFKDRYEDFLYIDRIAVSTAAHGKGLGKSVYADLQKRFKGQAPFLTCEVNILPPNPQSYEFHLKVGFKEVGQQDTKGGTIRVAMLQLALENS